MEYVADDDGAIFPQTRVAQVSPKLMAAIWGRQINSLFPVFAERIYLNRSGPAQLAFLHLIKMGEA